jgi:hypothetical protein
VVQGSDGLGRVSQINGIATAQGLEGTQIPLGGLHQGRGQGLEGLVLHLACKGIVGVEDGLNQVIFPTALVLG